MQTCDEIINEIKNSWDSNFSCLLTKKGDVKLVTPFSLQDGTLVTIFINENYITDYGETLSNLKIINIDGMITRVQQKIIIKIVENYRCFLDSGTIYHEKTDKLILDIIDIVQTMICISNLVCI